MPLDTQNLGQYRGATLCDRDGDKIGKIDEIYLDDRTGQPEWALVNTGLFGTRSTFVPLREASTRGDDLMVPYDKGKVKDAPQMEADGHLSEEEERQLYSYYGMGYDEPSYTGTDTTDTGVAAGTTAGYAGTTDYSDTSRTTARDVSGPETDDAMTLSEERVNVGTEQREAGRARLRKYITTDTVTERVPVQREEVRLEREPITDANRDAAYSGPDLSEEEVEVTLREEVPRVEKEVVPTERVRLDTETVTEEREVREDLRREEVDFDDQGRTDTTR
jgi:uncharacterized protein (TIGR02271 family)